MNQTDILYRAFTEYRKQTAEDASCKKLRHATRNASADLDKLEAIRSHCAIEEDWVNTIDYYLPYVEKAIREERQFIRQEGEVLPIEKAKHVSKDSVEHLARHSDMITHVPKEGDDLIPDKLYVVEKLSDFAVYENRFLYMLLCYMRDFIELRYTKIVELGHMYRAEMSMEKDIRIGKRRIRFKTELAEESKNDPFSEVDREALAVLDKIEGHRHIVASLLLTPLMREVSHSPMLKPPITRTNALRMDNNFKNALALYDYLVAYNKDGYVIETYKKTYGPFAEEMGDEFAELVAMTSFLTYSYGKEVRDVLRANYEADEQKRKEEKANRQRNKIRELKKRVAEEGKSMEEYMLLLEERNSVLEVDREKLIATEQKVEHLQEKISKLKNRQAELLGEIDVLHTESAEKDAQMVQMTEEHAVQMQNAKEAHDAEMLAAKQEAEQKQRDTVNRYEGELRDQRSSYEQKMEEQSEELRAQLQQAKEESEKLSAEGLTLRAELHAQKKINGNIKNEEDFTSKERFEELEKEYEALGALLGGEWKKTKKRIRNRVLWNHDDSSKE